MAKNNFKWLDKSSLILLAIAGLSWGLSGLGFNLFETISTAMNLAWIEGVILTLISVSAVWVGTRTLMGKIKFAN